MRVSVLLENRFERTPDGQTWTTGPLSIEFWDRYLGVFDHVNVVARVRRVHEPSAGTRRTDGENVEVHAVPYYVGPRQFALRWPYVVASIRGAIDPTDAVILRAPSQIGSCLHGRLRRTGRPYGVEVVGDPLDVFTAGAVRHPLRPLFRWLFVRALRRQCAGACGVAYVSNYVLPNRYPAAAGAFTTNYSSVTIRAEDLATSSRTEVPCRKPLRLLSVGSMEQMYKGFDVLLRALADIRATTPNVTLTLVGDGRHRQELEAMCRSLKIAQCVTFRGRLPAGEAIRHEFDNADLFVLPSRTEGLPRAMIEAMARGLPCIGSTAGGIPELLPNEDLVAPGDVTALAQKLREVLGTFTRLEAMSRRNLEKAGEYREDILTQRRIAFYQIVRKETERWLH